MVLCVCVQGERSLYLQLEPSKALMARAIVTLLEKNLWFSISLISEQDPAAGPTDGFVQALLSLTSHNKTWQLEEHIRLSATTLSYRHMEHKLRNLLENKSHVIILHCRTASLLLHILRIATQCGLTGQGYAWILTEDSVKEEPAIVREYPLGMLAIVTDHTQRHQDFIADAVSLISAASQSFAKADNASFQGFIGRKGCLQGNLPHQLKLGHTFYR